MHAQADRRAERLGGWAALATAVLALVRLAGLVLLARPGGFAGALALVTVSGLLTGAAQALAVDGTRRRLGAPSRLIWTASAAGWTGAALTAAGPLLVIGRVLLAHDADALGRGLLLGWLAAFATALWVAGAAAADWRRLRLPAWVRVVGALFAVLSLSAAVLPPVAALALPVSLAWWIGLGAALLRPVRSTSG